jgi:hypothetical protein
MMKRTPLCLQILRALVISYPVMLTRGEVRDRIGAPPDTAIDSRIRECRLSATYGAFDIPCTGSGKNSRYGLAPSEVTRAREFLKSKGIVA